MRTTLDFDELALEQALVDTPGKTQPDSDYVRLQRISEIGALEGQFHWEGSLDDLRLREPRA